MDEMDENDETNGDTLAQAENAVIKFNTGLKRTLRTFIDELTAMETAHKKSKEITSALSATVPAFRFERSTK